MTCKRILSLKEVFYKRNALTAPNIQEYLHNKGDVILKVIFQFKEMFHIAWVCFYKLRATRGIFLLKYKIRKHFEITPSALEIRDH